MKFSLLIILSILIIGCGKTQHSNNSTIPDIIPPDYTQLLISTTNISFAAGEASTLRAKRLPNNNYIVIKQENPVKARIYDEDGNLVIPEFNASTYSVNDYYQTNLAVLNNGDFVISYYSTHMAGKKAYIAERFSKDGSDVERGVTIAMVDNSIYLEEAIPYEYEAGNYGLFYITDQSCNSKHYNGNLTPTVNHGAPQPSAFFTKGIDCEILSNGNIAIVWADNSSGDHNVYRAIYTPSQTTISNTEQINTTSSGHQLLNKSKAIAALTNEKFVISWRDISSETLKIRILNNNGTPETPEIAVKSPSSGSILNNTVLQLKDDIFAVFWAESTDLALRAILFDSTGTTLSMEQELCSLRDDIWHDSLFFNIEKRSSGDIKVFYESCTAAR